MSQTIKGLSGFTVCKNCIELDYCIIEAVNSMLPICEEVVVGEMGSTDGTLELLVSLAAIKPKLRIVRIRDWTIEKGNSHWFVNALNETRGHLRFPMALQLDADEVFSDDPATIRHISSCVERKGAMVFDRLNLVRDAHSLIPEGECVGKYVTRCGPSHLVWCSDDPTLEAQELLNMAQREPDAKIFHLGFLRRHSAFYQKCRVVQGAFFDTYDSRLVEAEATGTHPFAKFPWWDRLINYNGYYPESVKNWLQSRGYKI